MPTRAFVLFLLACCGVLALAEYPCLSNYFDCGNGRCLALMWRCDGENDCGNHKDEMDCDNSDVKPLICHENQFACNDSIHCIPMTWRCNGYVDCVDGSDELYCDKDNSSTCLGFRCKNHMCIPNKWRCDGNADCKDSSDEEGCVATGSATPTCSKDLGEFLCSNGTCIPEKRVCDGKKDCPKGEDEGEHCGDSCKNSTCQHHCVKLPVGYSCLCKPGFRLNKDNRTCTAINQCREQDGICSQICINNQESYRCECNDGYLLRNNRTCYAQGPEPLLIFSNTKEIRGLWLRSNNYFLVQSALSPAMAVDFDNVMSRVYWVELQTNGASLYSSGLDGMDKKLLLKSGLQTPEDISIDWLARNFYIVDSGLRQILVCKLSGSLCHVLFNKGLDKPRALALNPPTGIMYWTDWGKVPGIYKSGMDGSNKVTIVSKDILWPNGLTLDISTNRIYWCDAKLNKIEWQSFDGSKRKVILEDKLFHPFSLAVFEDNLFWTDWKDYSLETCNKFSGREQKKLVKDASDHLIGVHIYHPLMRPKTPNPCWGSHCSHMCLLAPHGQYKCVCPRGFSLDKDGKTCLTDKSAPLMYVTIHGDIFQVHPEAVGKDIVYKLPISGIGAVGDLALDWETRTLYVSDVIKKVIFEVNTTTYTKRELVSTHMDSVEGMDFDFLGKNLYWTDAVKNTVEVATADGRTRTVLIQDMARPIDILLYPEKGTMFVASLSSNPNIAAFDMDGNNRRVLVPSNQAGTPVSISLDRKQRQLLWADARRSSIQTLELVPSRRRQILRDGLGRLVSVTMNGDFLYWTDMDNHNVKFSSRKDSTKGLGAITLPGSVNGSFVRKVTCLSKIDYVGTHCSNNRGGCSHMCLTIPGGHVCTCPGNLSLSSDGKNCLVPIVGRKCNAHEIPCASSGKCISSTWRCDGVKDCEDGSDELSCEMTCPPRDFQCKNGRCILPNWKCDLSDDCGDGSDEENCTTGHNCDNFHCGNGHCIPNLWRCDGQKDCSDGSDEHGCEQTECEENYLRCDNGQCLPIEWKCDGEKDCDNNTDERDCAYATCGPSEFQCEEGTTCIDKKMVCNHMPDCKDGSDEKNCSYEPAQCMKDQYRCNDGMCIGASDVCDSYEDCINGEDEVNCTIKECKSTEFYCSSGSRCIPEKWLCDGQDDCGDNADENLPHCHHPVTVTQVATTPVCQGFECLSGECLAWSQVCDGHEDCKDFSDEGTQCEYSCKDNGGCSQLCSHTPQGPVCSCNAGFTLQDDGKACEDNNECEQLVCSHYCNNTKGGYKCTCASGYLPHGPFHHHCKAKGPSATLLMLTQYQIKALSFHNPHHRILVESKKSKMTSMTYDSWTSALYWLDNEGTLRKYSPIIDERSIISNRMATKVAWDWLGQSMYYADSSTLGACSRDGSKCTILLNLESPVNTLALAPEVGFLFWSTSREDDGRIERADMDGSNRILLASFKIYLPMGLVVDHVHHSIYWTDMKLNVIERMDFSGQNRQTVMEKGLNHPSSIALFEDYIYWTDTGSDTIYKVDKFNIKEKLPVLHGGVKGAELLIVHLVNQPNGSKPCLSAKCQHICLLNPAGFTCRCGEGYDLANDSQTCLENGLPEETTQSTGETSPTNTPDCMDFCYNGGECTLVEGLPRCKCSEVYSGWRCEYKIQAASHMAHKSYNWVAGVVMGLLSVAAIVAAILLCRRQNFGAHKISNSIVVGFRNPVFGLRPSASLLTEEDGQDVDDELTGKVGVYRPVPQVRRSPADLQDTCASSGESTRHSSEGSHDSAFFANDVYSDTTSLVSNKKTSLLENYAKKT